MEQIKEMWELVFTWLGNGKKMIVGGIFLLAGMAGQIASGKTLAHIPFLLMAMGLVCFVNALFSRICACNINLLLCLLLYLLVAEWGIVAGGIILGAPLGDSTPTVILCWVCFVLVWAGQFFLIRNTREIMKRAVLAVLEVLMSLAAIAAAFLIPILLHTLLS